MIKLVQVYVAAVFANLVVFTAMIGFLVVGTGLILGPILIIGVAVTHIGVMNTLAASAGVGALLTAFGDVAEYRENMARKKNGGFYASNKS